MRVVRIAVKRNAREEEGLAVNRSRLELRIISPNFH